MSSDLASDRHRKAANSRCVDLAAVMDFPASHEGLGGSEEATC